MFTFLPAGEIDALTASGKNPNEAKERLAWEVTALIHGKEEADKAMAGARAAFGGGGGDKDAMPTAALSPAKFDAGYNVVDLFTDAALAPTKSEARRLVQQGGAFVSLGGGDLKAVTDVAALINTGDLDSSGELLLRAGKKRFCRVVTK
jgi:tyrosyl-tRNA synthetase